MKKRSLLSPLLVGLALMLSESQCSHAEELERFGKSSEAGSDESHRFMQNCMTCHNDDGNEASGVEGGWWNIAGSVFDANGSAPASSGTVELWSGPERTGTRYLSLPIDALGNFYTEKIIDYNGAAFPVVVNANGDFFSMSEPFTGGGCNGCHNNEIAAQLAMP
jgi:hypothetical protein